MPIELKNVNYTYLPGSPLSRTAINNINLTVNENEFLAIIGHTGSGKSTLIMHMNGLLQPSSGTVLVDGHDLADKHERKEARSLVGLVFQYAEYQLFEETVEKDIAYGPKNMGLSESEIKSRVKEAMELVGLDYTRFAEKSPFDMSGGEKRRAALAGIIAMHPKYLILDEPMAGLDPRGRASIIETITRLREALGCAVVMVSHSMDDVATVADRILVLSRGTIIEQGSPEEIFSDVSKLTAVGLDIPQIARFGLELQKRGIDVPGGIFTVEAMLDFLKGRLELC